MGQGRSAPARATRLRTVVEEPWVASEADSAADKFERGEEAFEAIKWAIARDPENGIPLNGGGLFAWFIQGARSIGLPTVAAVYTVTEDDITIKAVRFTEAQQVH